MNKTVNVFYAHSTHRETSYDAYLKVCEAFEGNDGINIMDVDKPVGGTCGFLNIIDHNLNHADMLVCDITPDFISPEHENKSWWNVTPAINANVMYELGYFYAKNSGNIMLIIHKDFADHIPSLLRGFYIYRYTDHEEIIERINEYKQVFKKLIE